MCTICQLGDLEIRKNVPIKRRMSHDNTSFRMFSTYTMKQIDSVDTQTGEVDGDYVEPQLPNDRLSLTYCHRLDDEDALLAQHLYERETPPFVSAEHENGFAQHASSSLTVRYIQQDAAATTSPPNYAVAKQTFKPRGPGKAFRLSDQRTEDLTFSCGHMRTLRAQQCAQAYIPSLIIKPFSIRRTGRAIPSVSVFCRSLSGRGIRAHASKREVRPVSCTGYAI